MAFPARSTVRPAASRTQPSLTQYSSTFVFSWPLNRTTSTCAVHSGNVTIMPPWRATTVVPGAMGAGSATTKGDVYTLPDTLIRTVAPESVRTYLANASHGATALATFGWTRHWVVRVKVAVEVALFG